MGSLFSKSKPPSTITDQDRAILSVKLERDKLKRARKRRELNLERAKEAAKELMQQGRKDRALLVWRTRKYEENILEQIENHLFKIEQVIADLETAQLNVSVVQKIKEGTEALNAINKAFPVDVVEKIMADSEHAIEHEQEISSIMTGSINEVDVEQEFNELFGLELPEVPTEEPVTAEKAKENPGKKKERETVLAS